MRRPTLTLACCGFLLVLGAAPPILADGPNIVLNPGFTSSTVAWSTGGTWVAEDAKGSPHSGALRLTNSLTGPNTFAPSTQCIPAVPGSYVGGLSAWVEQASPGDLVLLNFGFYSDNNCTVGIPFGADTPDLTTASWTDGAEVLVAKAGTHSAKLFIDLIRGPSAPHGTAVAYVDDVFLRTGTCAPSSTQLCLADGRFSVTASYSTASQSGLGHAVPFSNQSGKFWFFTATSVELDVKVLNGCAVNNRYWFFAAGLTNVQVTRRCATR